MLTESDKLRKSAKSFGYRFCKIKREEVPEVEQWTPDSEYYKQLLLEDLPVDNYYQWCYDCLKAEVKTVDMAKFIAISLLKQ